MNKFINIVRRAFFGVLCTNVLSFSIGISAMCPRGSEPCANHISTTCKTWQEVNDTVAQLQYSMGDFPVALIGYDGTLVTDNAVDSDAVKCVKNFTNYGLSSFVITAGKLLEHRSRMKKLQRVGLSNEIAYKSELFNLKKTGYDVVIKESTGFRAPEYKFRYMDGLLYSLYYYDRASKGKAFDKFVRYFKQSPSYAIMIDNNNYNLCAVALACKAHKISCHTILVDFTK
ncbi:MAG: DUF2608 domain-containing protein [Holosporaceae bacterium]|jgi:hypothetical protein|nr:DUF2608 domain-containing protein [Holosporaceae bacterium]